MSGTHCCKCTLFCCALFSFCRSATKNTFAKNHFLKATSTGLIFSSPLFSSYLTSFFKKFLEVIEQTGTPPACLSEELQRLRAEDQLKQRKLEESHREEVACLRAHYQQQATETEERYLTELLMLQQQLQDVTDPHSRWWVPILKICTYCCVSLIFSDPDKTHANQLFSSIRIFSKTTFQWIQLSFKCSSCHIH